MTTGDLKYLMEINPRWRFDARLAMVVTWHTMWLADFKRYSGIDIMRLLNPASRQQVLRAMLALLACLVVFSPAVAADPVKKEMITEAEVNAAQQAWCDGLVKIGKVHKEGGDYKAVAAQIINDLYDYND